MINMLNGRRVILFFCFLTFLAFLILNFAAPHKIEGDGVFYYSWLHSVFFDRDIDFKNQLEYFAHYDTQSALILKYQTTPIGKTPNAYASGAAVMWLPFFLIANLLSLIFQNFNAEFFRPDGYSYFYLLMLNFAGWFYGAAAVLMVYKILKLIFGGYWKFSNHFRSPNSLSASVIPAKAGIQNKNKNSFQNSLDPRFRGDDEMRTFSDKAAVLSVLAIWLATPLVYYQMLEPYSSHLPSLFLASVWFYLLIKIWRGERVNPIKSSAFGGGAPSAQFNGVNPWLLAAVIFLLLATRWQNAVFLIGYLPFLWRERRDFKKFLFFIAPIVIFTIIQSLIWKNLYGEYFLTPQGIGFIRPQIHLLYTLFSTNRGLLTWSPILILALAGFYPLFKKVRFWAVLSVVIFILVWILNSSLNDLGGGDAFGGRRFIEALPFLALGLGALLEKFDKKKIGRLIIIAIITVFILWNLILMENYRQGAIPHAGEFDFFGIDYLEAVKKFFNQIVIPRECL